MKISVLAEKIGANVFFPDGCVNSENNCEIGGFNGLEQALSTDISFLVSDKFLDQFAVSKAAVVIVAKEYPEVKIPQLVHVNPYFAFGIACSFFVKRATSSFSGAVSALAILGKNIKLGKNITIYPHATIDDNAEIGDNSVVFSGVYVGRNAKIGCNSELRANSVLENDCEIGNNVLIHAGTVIGSDGFGFAPGALKGAYTLVKIPQIGRVVIDDDVEIGAGCTVDRGAFGLTKIGKGTKIDSSVHIGHNVDIGEFSMLCGGVSVAGSVKIGSRVILAGQVGVSNGVEICDGAVIAGRSGVTKSVQAAGTYAGFPLMTVKEWRKEIVNIRRIEKIDERLKKIERQKS